MKSHRRGFLGAMGLSALAPFVPVLNPRAQAQGFPRRLLLVFTGNGTVDAGYWPTGSGTNYSFTPGSIHEPLERFKPKLIFPRRLRRLTSGSGAHEKNMGGLWTGCGLVRTNGYPRGPSIDQVIARTIESPAAFKSLAFGAQCDSFNRGGNKPVLKSMTYSARDSVVTPEDNPLVMFQKLMIGPGMTPQGPMGGINTEALEKARAKRKSVLDAVGADLKALSARIDREDRAKLENHLEGLSSLEKRLTGPINPAATGGGCSAPDLAGKGFDSAEARLLNENFQAIMEAQNRLAVAALACDRTRVATLQWSRSFSPIIHNWVGVREDHHTLSHKTSANDIRQLHAINRWYAERFSELLTYLDSVPEGSGTLLDNTVVIWGNEANTGNHGASPAVAVMAGSCGGQLKTGQYVELNGYDWSQLLVTLAHAMGANSINSIGDLGMKDGDIPALRA